MVTAEESAQADLGGAKRRTRVRLALYIYDETEVLAICDRIHDGRYTWKRPLLKAGTTEIIWVPAPKLSDPEILMVEADLIEALNPSANLSRPTPVRLV